MSELVTTRIREHAVKLGLTHLGDGIGQLVTRAETDQMGYLDFVDLLLEEELGACGKDADSATPSNCPGCRTTR